MSDKQVRRSEWSTVLHEDEKMYQLRTMRKTKQKELDEIDAMLYQREGELWKETILGFNGSGKKFEVIYKNPYSISIRKKGTESN